MRVMKHEENGENDEQAIMKIMNMMRNDENPELKHDGTDE